MHTKAFDLVCQQPTKPKVARSYKNQLEVC